MKNLLSPAVKIGDLWRLNYNKIIFGQGSAPDPAGRAHDVSQIPESDEEGTFPPHFPPFASGPKSTSFSFWIGIPLFRPKLRH